MALKYEATLRGDRIEWVAGSPPLPAGDQPVRVSVEVLGSPAVADANRRAKLNAALERLAASDVHLKFGDPLEWEREQRRDRPLPGRDES